MNAVFLSASDSISSLDTFSALSRFTALPPLQNNGVLVYPMSTLGNVQEINHNIATQNQSAEQGDIHIQYLGLTTAFTNRRDC